MMSTPKVHHVDVLLSCSKGAHENCAALRDAVFENFRQVTRAYTTRTHPDTGFCVSASAIVRRGDIDKFKRQLKAIRGTDKTAGPSVSKVKLFVSA